VHIFHHLLTSRCVTNDSKYIQNAVKTEQIYYTLLLQGYMFRLLRISVSPSNELTQDYLIPSALWDPKVH